MTINYHWLVPDRVLYGRMSGTLTRTDLVASTQTLVETLDRVDAPVHVIYNVFDLMPYHDLAEFSDLSRPVLTHPRLGWMVIYGAGNPGVEFLLVSMLKRFRTRVRFVSTPHAAVVFVRAIDSSVLVRRASS